MNELKILQNITKLCFSRTKELELLLAFLKTLESEKSSRKDRAIAIDLYNTMENNEIPMITIVEALFVAGQLAERGEIAEYNSFSCKDDRESLASKQAEV